MDTTKRKTAASGAFAFIVLPECRCMSPWQFICWPLHFIGFAYGSRVRKTYEVPTKEMLADAILKKAFRPTGLTNVSLLKYELPDNLKRFFEGKERKTATSSCCCSGGCDCC